LEPATRLGAVGATAGSPMIPAGPGVSTLHSRAGGTRRSGTGRNSRRASPPITAGTWRCGRITRSERPRFAVRRVTTTSISPASTISSS